MTEPTHRELQLAEKEGKPAIVIWHSGPQLLPIFKKYVGNAQRVQLGTRPLPQHNLDAYMLQVLACLRSMGCSPRQALRAHSEPQVSAAPAALQLPQGRSPSLPSSSGGSPGSKGGSGSPAAGAQTGASPASSSDGSPRAAAVAVVSGNRTASFCVGTKTRLVEEIEPEPATQATNGKASTLKARPLSHSIHGASKSVFQGIFKDASVSSGHYGAASKEVHSRGSFYGPFKDASVSRGTYFGAYKDASVIRGSCFAPSKDASDRRGSRQGVKDPSTSARSPRSQSLQAQYTGSSAPECLQSDLLTACKAGDADMVTKLLSQFSDAAQQLNCKEYQAGLTPLHAACLGGHALVVEALLKAGADPSVKGQWGVMPLHAACESGHTAVVEALLRAGADTSAVTKAGDAPMHLASAGGHTAVLNALLKAGADVGAKNEAGDTPLRVATIHGHRAAVDTLLREEVNRLMKGRGAGGAAKEAAGRPAAPAAVPQAASGAA